MAETPTEWVTVRHPDHGPDGGTGRFTRQAFVEVLAPQGWVEVDPATAKASDMLGKPVTDLKALKKEELASLASQLGHVTDETASKNDLEKIVSEGLAPSEEVVK